MTSNTGSASSTDVQPYVWQPLVMEKDGMNQQMMIEYCLAMVHDPQRSGFERRVWREFAVQAFASFNDHYETALAESLKLDLGQPLVQKKKLPTSIVDIMKQFHQVKADANKRFHTTPSDTQKSYGRASDSNGRRTWTDEEWDQWRKEQAHAAAAEKKKALAARGCSETNLWNLVVISFHRCDIARMDERAIGRTDVWDRR